MRLRFSLTTSSVAVAILAATSLAQAEVYTWTDANGRVNVSNLPPPEGVRVLSVVREPPPTQAQLEARREAARQAELQALNERVRQLEYEVETARHPIVPPVAFAPIPQPAVVQNVLVESAPAQQPQYVAGAPTASTWNLNPWCDPMWISCGAWLGPQLYPALPAIVVRTGSFRRPSPGHSGRPVINPKPVHPSPPPRLVNPPTVFTPAPRIR